MDAAAFRRLAVGLPAALEGAHHGHADFRAHGRIFASLHPDGVRAMVKVPPLRQRELVAAHPGVFTPATGAWGRAGCTMVVLAAAAPHVVEQALLEAWQFAGGAAATAGRTGRAGRARPGASRRPRPKGR